MVIESVSSTQSKEVGVAITHNRMLVQELLNKLKTFSRESGNVVLGLIQNLSFHYQVFFVLSLDSFAMTKSDLCFLDFSNEDSV